jgi:undecaprenyl-diphosphatase
VALGEFLHHPDQQLGGRLRRLTIHPRLAVLMVVATRTGDGWAWLALAAILPAAGDRGRRLLAAEVVTVAAVNALQVALKHSFRRPRPRPDVFIRSPLVRAPDAFSFPSGHTMNAFALAALVVPDAPLLAPPLAVFASVVGASRVGLGLHYPSDVGAGALLGIAIATSVRWLVLS